MLKCVENGEIKVDQFINETLDASGDVNFHAAIKKTPMKTFADLQKKVKVKAKSGFKLAHTSPELIMRRGLAIMKFRPELDLEAIMSIPTGGAPLSLFHEDGLMRSPSSKADIAHVLETKLDTKPPTTWPALTRNTTVFVIDASVLIRKLQAVHQPKLFVDLAEKVMDFLVSRFVVCSIILYSCDSYEEENDVKDYERRRRATSDPSSPSPEPFDVIGGAQIPKWSSFTDLPQNKRNLNIFICEYLEKNKGRLGDNCTLIMSGGFKDSSTTTQSQRNYDMDASGGKINGSISISRST